MSASLFSALYTCNIQVLKRRDAQRYQVSVFIAVNELRSPDVITWNDSLAVCMKCCFNTIMRCKTFDLGPSYSAAELRGAARVEVVKFYEVHGKRW
jgi:hypothetical protein